MSPDSKRNLRPRKVDNYQSMLQGGDDHPSAVHDDFDDAEVKLTPQKRPPT